MVQQETVSRLQQRPRHVRSNFELRSQHSKHGNPRAAKACKAHILLSSSLLRPTPCPLSREPGHGGGGRPKLQSEEGRLGVLETALQEPLGWSLQLQGVRAHVVKATQEAGTAQGIPRLDPARMVEAYDADKLVPVAAWILEHAQRLRHHLLRAWPNIFAFGAALLIKCSPHQHRPSDAHRRCRSTWHRGADSRRGRRRPCRWGSQCPRRRGKGQRCLVECRLLNQGHTQHTRGKQCPCNRSGVE
mmetsp:Transcript_50384/g.163046  ORF Transcript_50384/g.163046 Transcript_50384/m.163046 type:complete len:245 (-) Transcript_50384:3-737(-)